MNKKNIHLFLLKLAHSNKKADEICMQLEIWGHPGHFKYNYFPRFFGKNLEVKKAYFRGLSAKKEKNEYIFGK